ncbi:alpha/beta hydrolase family protein [Kutzneria chonburiensis]|uniref:Alpha/beta hydrolase family protein n=1 Tax=Kutzneria chonburiensis TaxID=1483604 RepID=A0ABV6N113_9PSEU|nr:alpha/beta hydrolase [Kutzneria chonburiensis]
MRGTAILAAVGLLLGGAATAQAAPAAVAHEQFTFQFGDFTGGGQLDYPTNVQHAPVVVLIPGSGPENRDANVLGKSHIFADISDALTARGFAVMRYDKRYVHPDGTADYQSFYSKLDLPKMLDDAGQVLAAAEASPHVDPHQVFLYGWSEGSTVAAALATKHPELAGVAFQGPVAQDWRSLFTDQATRVAQPYLKTFGQVLGPDDLKRAVKGGGGLVATEYIGFVAPGSYNGTDYTVSPTFDANGDGKLDVDTEFLPGLEKTFDTAFQPGNPFNIYGPDRALPSVLDQAKALRRFPTLILQGGRDANVPPAGAFKLNAALHGSLRFYPALGHSLGRTPSLFADDFQPIDQRPLTDLACWLSEHLRQK